jgi:phosphocarrier protein
MSGPALDRVVAEREIELGSPLGLHARPAAAFAEEAAGFRAAITVAKDGYEVDATSLLLLLTLDARRGDRLVIRARGDDAAVAVDRLAALLVAP